MSDYPSLQYDLGEADRGVVTVTIGGKLWFAEAPRHYRYFQVVGLDTAAPKAVFWTRNDRLDAVEILLAPSIVGEGLGERA